MLNWSPCDGSLRTDAARLHTGGVGSVHRPVFTIQKHTLFIIWAHYYACNIFRAFCAFTFSDKQDEDWNLKKKKKKH